MDLHYKMMDATNLGPNHNAQVPRSWHGGHGGCGTGLGVAVPFWALELHPE